MAIFQYMARTTSGEKVDGEIEAATESAAVRVLDEKQLFPISMTERAERKGVGSGVKLRRAELANLYEQLSDLLRAGVPMMRALETLKKTGSSQRVSNVMTEIFDAVSGGSSLSEAMRERPQSFDPLQAAMVAAGERGGFLEEVLADLSEFLEKQDQLRNSVRGAMIYPIILIIIGFIAVAACLVWMVPKFQPLFEGKPLPLPSVMLFAASDLFVEYWQFSFAAIILGFIIFLMFLKSESGTRLANIWKLRIPVIGSTLLMVSVTRFCRILGTMLGSGVPLLQSLDIARDAAGLPQLADAIENAGESVKKGEGLTPTLEASGLFPPQLIEMLSVAEESNQLEKVLLKIAATIERRTTQRVEQAVRLLEPLILTLLAGVILFIAIGLLVPIFTMAQSMR